MEKKNEMKNVFIHIILLSLASSCSVCTGCVWVRDVDWCSVRTRLSSVASVATVDPP